LSFGRQHCDRELVVLEILKGRLEEVSLLSKSWQQALG